MEAHNANRIIRAAQNGMMVEPYVTLEADENGIMLTGKAEKYNANFYLGWVEIETANVDVLNNGVDRVRNALNTALKTGSLPLAI